MDRLKRLGQAYMDALTEVVATITGTHLQAGSREPGNDLEDITGVMYLSSNKNGILFVTAKEDDVRVLCSRFIGVPLEEVTENDLYDTMCELVNMTAGNANLRIYDVDYIFRLSQPFVLKGKDISIINKPITHIEAGTLTDGNISVSFKAVY